jgi:hypothetical protein
MKLNHKNESKGMFFSMLKNLRGGENPPSSHVLYCSLVESEVKLNRSRVDLLWILSDINRRKNYINSNEWHKFTSILHHVYL